MTGVTMIADERLRQVVKEEFDSAHDAQHKAGELAIAAACYAVNHMPNINVVDRDFGGDAWPWHTEWDKRKKHDRMRSLAIAGALIAAEIDRLTNEAEAKK